jgi:hypothetical protein
VLSPVRKKPNHPAWRYMSIIPALRRLKQEDQEFRASQGYLERTVSKKKKRKKAKQTNRIRAPFSPRTLI